MFFLRCLLWEICWLSNGGWYMFLSVGNMIYLILSVRFCLVFLMCCFRFVKDFFGIGLVW